MKNKLLKSAGIAFLLLAVLASNVFAFSLGTTDGLWGRIDSTTAYSTGADCERYGAVNAPTYTLYDAVGIIYNVNVGPGGQTEKYVRNPSVCTGDPNGDIGFAGNNSFGEWTRSTTDLWSGFGTPNITCSTPSGLFISEYSYQLRNNNDDRLAIEIYNGTGGTVNLGTGNYSLLIFTDDRAFDKIDLTGTVTAGDVYVIATTSVGSNQTSHVDQFFTINESYRTVVLVKDYNYASVTDYGDQDDRVDIYGLSPLDENQVRYGSPSPGSCPNENGNNTAMFDLQSGFGFAGQDDSNFEPEEDELFPIGRFCHYNNPISSGRQNDLNTVPLTLTINELGCPPGQTFDPSAPSNDLDFDFLFTLDETPNAANPCAYGPSASGWPGGSAQANVAGDIGPNRSGCADMVRITAPDTDQSFTCVIDAEHDQEYFVSIMGFTETPAGGICPNVPSGTIHFNQIYTAERVRNCYCVYASYTRSQITPVTLAFLSAEGVENGILISWETVSETNNFGFNILRAESKDGERIQINPELIFSSLAPGDPFGSSYDYLDETAVPGTEYFYWLEDIPLDSSGPGLHGPISAVWGVVAE